MSSLRSDDAERVREGALRRLREHPDLDELRIAAHDLAYLTTYYKPRALRSALLEAFGAADDRHPQREAAELAIKRAFKEVTSVVADVAERIEHGARYVDVAAVLEGDTTPVVPDAGGVRADGLRMLYAGKVNGLVGESETAKSIAAACMVADELRLGGSALWVDLDHNGAEATVARLVAADVDRDVLRDPSRFRLSIPESRAGILGAVEDAAEWQPTLAVVDSVGEVVPMFGGDSNNADDYSRVHRAVFAPLAAAGAAVLVIDHLAKTALGTGYASGTGAKKRAMDGAYYGVKLIDTFRPGVGGASALTILKDRHGGVRAATASDTAAVFRLDSRAGSWTWEFHPGRSDDDRASDQAEADIAFVLALESFPTGRGVLQAAVRAAYGKGWSNDRAAAVLKAARARREAPATFPIDSTRDN